MYISVLIIIQIDYNFPFLVATSNLIINVRLEVGENAFIAS